MNFRILIFLFFHISFSKDIEINQNLVHPCLSSTLKQPNNKEINREPLIYYEKDISKNKHISFTKNIHSSYLFNQYYVPMSIVREIINYDYYIKNYNNPRYYLLKALEDLNLGEYESSKLYLNKYISFSDIYIKSNFYEKKAFFISGCSIDDIDWVIKNHNKSFEYEISLILIEYLDDVIQADQLIDKLKKIDLNPSIFDLCDNIILMIMKNHNYTYEEFNFFFNSIESLQLNRLIYNDGYNYPLSSQILGLSMFKYFQAENEFKLSEKSLYIDYIQKIDIDNYNHKFLFPLMYYFELKLDLFKYYDQYLYDMILMIIEEIKIQYSNDFDNQYTTWLDLYSPEQKNYNKFINNIVDYQNNLINKKNKPDSNYIETEFKNLVTNNSKVDSIYFTKIFQYLNNNNFFYNISNRDNNSSRIPIIHKNIEDSFNKNIALDNLFSFSNSVGQKTKKIYYSSLLSYYLYDFYNGHESKMMFNKVLNTSKKINDGIKPFTDSMKILQLVLEPPS